MAQNNDIGAVVMAVFIMCVGWGIWRWWDSAVERTIRALKKLAPTRICEAERGQMIKIIGSVRYVAAHVKAPLSGRACAYYHVRVEERFTKGSWRTVVSEGGGVDFLVDDGTGRALVRADVVQTAAVEDENFRSSKPTRQLEAFLRQHGVNPKDLFGLINKEIRYHEGVFQEGETVAVMGIAKFDDGLGLRAGKSGSHNRPKALRIAPLADGHILMSDDPAVCDPSPLRTPKG